MRLAVGTMVILLASIITLLVMWPEAPSETDTGAVDVPAEHAEALRRANEALEDRTSSTSPRSSGALLSGVVLDAETQRPIEGARVVATVEKERGFSSNETGPDGQFSLACAPGRDLTIEVFHESYHSPDVRNGRQVDPVVLRLQEGERRSDLVLSIERASEIVGRVVSEEEPVAGAKVEIWRGDEPVTEEPITTGDDGHFRVRRLFAGDHRVRVVAGSRPEHVETVTLRPTEVRELTVDIPSGIDLSGLITDANDAPLAGLLVGLSDPRGTGEAVFTGPDGRFAIPHLRPGRFELRIQSVDPDRQLPISETWPFTIDDDTTEKRLDIQLD
ncbi:MAG: carboxypeptidase regulatory-like domain-containing protein [Planctomycetota bacterium]